MLTSNRNHLLHHRSRWNRGFSLIELMVVGGMVAALFIVTAVVYRTVGQNQGRSVSFQPVILGKGITNAFYPDAEQRASFGTSATEMPASIDVMAAPNYGTEYEVSVMREVILEDTNRCCAVFVLPRGPIGIDTTSTATTIVPNINYIHPPTTPDTGGGPDLPPYLVLNRPGTEIDHPNAFLDFLLSLYPDTVSNPFPFIDRSGTTAVTGYYRGVPTGTFVNASIFFIQPSHRTDALMLRCVWEIDLIRVDSAPGVFASVRRYFGAKLTHFYHILYTDPRGGPALQPSDFGPIMACFERQSRKAITEGTQADAFKVAPNRSFYYVWWPSPSLASLRGTAIGGTALPATDPRSYYTQHEQQTPIMHTVPMFPGQ